MKYRKILTNVVISSLVVACLAPSSFAASSQQTKNESFTTSEHRTLLTSDGNYLGTVDTETLTTITTKGDETSFTVTENNDYKLSPEYAQIKEYQERFSDGKETHIYNIVGNEIYADGKLLNGGSDRGNRVSLLSDTGGVPAISHYYSNKNLTSYTFGTYNDIEFQSRNYMGPAGKNVGKSILRTSSYFQDAKAAVDSFEGNYASYHEAMVALYAALGTLILTWQTVVGAVVGGGAAAVAATAAINRFNDCDSDVADAYMYVSNA
ncbi:hypothetical protein I6N90_21625 [Paenibacillus sp. GSMTC-2017]|uniref:hypothetical protein n=1 Tax=Paenibacillus sp. GSMTC-2017 TaxID=2794350 RepID=UPI0018D76EBE|nr:hypothetical protein [Paenibacillus sp. GSMTC-2017]MBH5320397.1 hypothetical protein [Paenibacillus sp. GSMTC-2017]